MTTYEIKETISQVENANKQIVKTIPIEATTREETISLSGRERYLANLETQKANIEKQISDVKTEIIEIKTLLKI